MKRTVILLSIIPIILFLITACSKVEHYELSRFVSPETCGGCHIEIYEQWKGSMHKLAQIDKIYLKVVKHDLEGLTDPDHIKEAESCVTCHVPVGVLSGNPKKSSDEMGKVPDLAKEGIQCDYCHSVTGAYQLYNAKLKIQPGNGEEDPGTKRGPRRNAASSYHKTAYSEFHTSAEICATCHDVRHVVYGTQLENTYNEWKNGPYNSENPKKRRVCQGCHMYDIPGSIVTGATEQRANPGQSSVDGPKRKHIFTHYFVGGNSLIPGMYDGLKQSKMAIDKLQNCTTVTIGAENVKDGKISVTVKNTGAGHKIPTGVTQIRQVWLKLSISVDGKNIYKSGHLDKNGYMSKNAIVYYTVFGDRNGNPVINLAKAEKILSDKRLEPLKARVENISGLDIKGNRITVEAALQYRILPQKLIDKLFGKGKLKIPVITMSKDKKVFSLK